MTAIERVFSILKKTGLQQNDLANYAGVPTSTLSNWILKKRDIPASKIIPICEFLNVSILYLLTGTGEQANTESQDEVRLIEKFRMLDEDGKDIIKATTLQELRRMEREKPLEIVSKRSWGQDESVVSTQENTPTINTRQTAKAIPSHNKKKA